jgi:hypothetical protein
MRPSLLHAADLMREARASACEQGFAATFPFVASDVEAIHTQCSRYGRGIYFRLKDGRVFSAFGMELDPDPTCYDTLPDAVPTSPLYAPMPPDRRS